MIDGKLVDTLLAIDPLKGSVYPPVLEGHAPRADDEIVLAPETLAKLHRHIGQSVHVDERRWASNHPPHRRDHDLPIGRRPLHE